MGLRIFYIILIIIAVAQFVWTLFFQGNYIGELIVTLEKKGKNRTLWFGLLIFWAIALIYEFSIFNGNISSVRVNNVLPVFWIIICILQITRGKDPTEIRSKGMSFDNRFYKYSKLTSYIWLEGDVLRVNYKNIFKRDDYFEIKIQDNEVALKADEALEKYINKKV